MSDNEEENQSQNMEGEEEEGGENMEEGGEEMENHVDMENKEEEEVNLDLGKEGNMEDEQGI